jgi:TPR repeat protein
MRQETQSIESMSEPPAAQGPGSRQGDRRVTLLIYAVIAALSLLALWPLIESERLAARGEDAARRGDFAAALEAWRPLAEGGDADAQFRLGVLHDRGLGTREDPFAAVDWYRRAAEQGSHAAQVNLGLMLVEGRGVDVDEAAAAAWFDKAATANVPEGLANLGHLYRVGRGVERDPVRAYALLRRAALFGNATAALGVAQMIASGEGVEPDPVEALAWARLTAGRDGPSAAPARRLADALEAELDEAGRRAADELGTAIDRQIAR